MRAKVWLPARSALAAVGALLMAVIGGAAAVPTPAAAATSQPASCALGSPAGNIQHVIYLQFDNVHYRRDNPNVPSDLEQMPHLLNFLEQNGTLFTNDHTVLISHTAGGIVSTLTGLYPDRQGLTSSNSYDYYQPNGQPSFTSAFKYWTDPVSSADPRPNVVTDGQKTTPAPWVPYTRAGCDVGAVGTANIELENTSTAPGGDITKVFGNPSPQATEASTNPHLAQTDFVGIAIHCAQAASSKCAGDSSARPDQLPGEPGGYNGYQGLFGAKYVDPAVTGGQAAVNSTSGTPITDPAGNPGFPGFDGMLPQNTLGYIEQMQESGVPVTYGYISDAHDIHTPNAATDSYHSTAAGPGEAAYEQQLKTYDQAFAQFIQNLAAHGINKSNTLFAMTVDEGDHFAGGVGTPQPDGTLGYSHTTCTDLSACPANQIGELEANMPALLPAGEPGYDISFDSAPRFYVDGQPGRTDPSVRKLEQDVGALTSVDPYLRNSGGTPQTVPLTAAMADTVEEQTLHMINTDPARTPTFTDFGNPDFYFQLSNCSGVPVCASPGFAWNHGDIQSEIGNTWVGLVGPGVQSQGVDSTTWTDHTNLRPTELALLGLHDDYVDDGRVLVEAMTTQATPTSLVAHRDTLLGLGAAYEQVNASFGSFSMDTLKASTRALESTDPSTYNSIETSIASLTAQRNAVASQMRAALNGAAFGGQALDEQQAKGLIAQASSLISQAQTLGS